MYIVLYLAQLQYVPHFKEEESVSHSFDSQIHSIPFTRRRVYKVQIRLPKNSGSEIRHHPVIIPSDIKVDICVRTYPVHSTAAEPPPNISDK